MRLIRKREIINRINLAFYNSKSFSQYGEDKIVYEMLGIYNLRLSTYMDIGANHPFLLNNTALFYGMGYSGINIEPDPLLYSRFIKERKRDINLNVGVHKKKGKLKYYQFERSEFNTFSEDSARKTELCGIKKINEVEVPVDTYNSIVEEYLNSKPPEILFLDAEGLDEEIIKSIDFSRYAPIILCVETFAFGGGLKNYKLIDFLLNNNYKIHADTYVNTIFILKSFS
jgi:FkbM family methyltransferase